MHQLYDNTYVAWGHDEYWGPACNLLIMNYINRHGKGILAAQLVLPPTVRKVNVRVRTRQGDLWSVTAGLQNLRPLNGVLPVFDPINSMGF